MPANWWTIHEALAYIARATGGNTMSAFVELQRYAFLGVIRAREDRTTMFRGGHDRMPHVLKSKPLSWKFWKLAQAEPDGRVFTIEGERRHEAQGITVRRSDVYRIWPPEPEPETRLPSSKEKEAIAVLRAAAGREDMTRAQRKLYVRRMFPKYRIADTQMRAILRAVPVRPGRKPGKRNPQT